MAVEKSDDQLKKWLDESLWITCKIDEKGFKFSRITREKSEKASGSSIENTNKDSNFQWLDDINYHPSVLPIREGETFCSGEEDTKFEYLTEDAEDVVFLESDFDDESYSFENDSEDKDNGKVLPLFISQALCAKPHKESFKLGSLVFKSLQIFGTVIGTQTTSRNNLLVIDDGTAQIKCFMEDYINVDNSVHDGPEISEDSQFYAFDQFFKEDMRKNENLLPSFDKINNGDRVLIDGDLSFYKGNYYIFIEGVVRYEDIERHIDFMKSIYHSIDIKYYDFGNLNQ